MSCGQQSGSGTKTHENPYNLKLQAQAYKLGKGAIGCTATVKERANVRKKPHEEGKWLASVPADAQYEILDVSLTNNTHVWYKIQMESGTVGWISAVAVNVDTSNVTFASDSATQTLKIIKACNIRQEPSSSSKRLAKAKVGSTYGVMDSKKVGEITWYKIEYTYQSYGWVAGTKVQVN